MNSLIEKRAASELSEVLWHLPNNNHVNISSLLSFFNLICIENWIGKRVALGKIPAVDLAAALIFLDGLAEIILILPNNLEPNTRTAWLETNKIDVVIDNDEFSFLKAIKKSDLSIVETKYQDILVKRSKRIETKWMLATSGTTNIPKLIPHTSLSLTKNMSNRELTDKYVWGSLYGLRRFAGLQVFLQAWIAKTPLLLIEDEADLSSILNALVHSGCNAMSATPSMWRKLAMHPLFKNLELQQITLGGEIVDQKILNMLSNEFPKARITHIYASTEVGVGFTVRDGKAGFPKNFLEENRLNPAIKINRDGHLLFCSKTLHSPGHSENWIDSGDIVQIIDDRVYFLGRANGSINVGGNKVMPEEVEAIINELPEVAFVQIQPRKNGIMGNLVEAKIKMNNGFVFDANFKKKVILHCRTKLEVFKIPAFITEIDEIILSSSGKSLRKIEI